MMTGHLEPRRAGARTSTVRAAGLFLLAAMLSSCATDLQLNNETLLRVELEKRVDVLEGKPGATSSTPGSDGTSDPRISELESELDAMGDRLVALEGSVPGGGGATGVAGIGGATGATGSDGAAGAPGGSSGGSALDERLARLESSVANQAEDSADLAERVETIHATAQRRAAEVEQAAAAVGTRVDQNAAAVGTVQQSVTDLGVEMSAKMRALEDRIAHAGTTATRPGLNLSERMTPEEARVLAARVAALPMDHEIVDSYEAVRAMQGAGVRDEASRTAERADDASGEPDPFGKEGGAAGDIETADSDDMTLYYATSRQPLTRAERAAPWLKLLMWPAVFLLLLFVVPVFLKKFIHADYARRVVIGSRIVCVALIAAFIGLGAMKVKALWEDNHLDVVYGNERFARDADGNDYDVGTCRIEVPPDREFADPASDSIFRAEISIDMTKHFHLATIEPREDDAFYESLEKKVRSSPLEDVFVFVHGFNNPFKTAAIRTAQISYDLNFEGAPVFFSWPSQGEAAKYTYDENEARLAAWHLADFLIQIATRAKPKNIHLVAHSMGNRVLMRAMLLVAHHEGNGIKFNEVVFAAPDLDKGEFEIAAAEVLQHDIAENYTLYASSGDGALAMSKKFHGKTRAGLGIPPAIIEPDGRDNVAKNGRLRFESIDVSEVSSGHSYIADCGSILRDVREILLRRSVAEREAISNLVYVREADLVEMTTAEFGAVPVSDLPRGFWRFKAEPVGAAKRAGM